MAYQTHKIFNWISGLCSIASFLFAILFLFLENNTCAWIALGIVCFFLLYLLIVIAWSFVSVQKRAFPDGYIMDFVVITYDVISEKYHKHDLYKIIQSKRPFLYSINHEFSWTGTKSPIISSELQDVGKKTISNDPDKFDAQELILKRPLLYNQTTTAHFHADLDDSDGKAKPFLAFTVKVPMSMIYFKITLREKDENYSKKAKVKRIPTKEGPLRSEKDLGDVIFDSKTKSYTYKVEYPEAGYTYKIIWEK